MAANLPMVNIKLSPASGLSPGVYSKVKLIVRDEPTAAATAPGNPNKTSLPAAGIRWCGNLRTKQPQGQQRQDQFDPREQAQGHREAQAKQFAEEEASKSKANKLPSPKPIKSVNTFNPIAGPPRFPPSEVTIPAKSSCVMS